LSTAVDLFPGSIFKGGDLHSSKYLVDYFSVKVPSNVFVLDFVNPRTALVCV
jgi:hypothetical protein